MSAHPPPLIYHSPPVAPLRCSWGYCDCNGNNPIGLEWAFGEWGDCSKTCGGGMRTRTVTCRNSTTSEKVDDPSRCGKIPPTMESCNTQSCDTGCGLPPSDRKICAGYYQDFRSKVSSEIAQKSLCQSYGCCFAALSDADSFKLGAPKCYTSSSHPAESAGCKSASRGAGEIRPGSISVCGDQCCSSDTTLGTCGHTVGYAELKATDPCGRYKSSINTESEVGWRSFPVGRRSSTTGSGSNKACTPLSTTKESSVKACQAACALAAGCNAINYNSPAQICELVQCEDPARPSTLTAAGWLIFSFGTISLEPVASWVIGPDGWSDCIKKATGVTWGTSTCEMSQTREVDCLDTNGKKLADEICAKKEPKPEFHRTCWGSCGVKRSCEE